MVGGFEKTLYWSSTTEGYSTAQTVFFDPFNDGHIGAYPRDYPDLQDPSVRPVRAF